MYRSGYRNKPVRGSIAHRYSKKRKGFSYCTTLYLQALLDPTSDAARKACVPFGFPMPSQKCRAFARGQMSVVPPASVGGVQPSSPVAGYGFIMCAVPLVNDIAAVLYTTGNAPNTTPGGSSLDANTIINTWLTSSSGTNQTTCTTSVTLSTLDFTSTQISATNGSVDGRLVCGGIRIRYIGNDDLRNGVVASLEEPNHLDLAAMTLNTIFTYEACHRRPLADGQWHCCYWTGPVVEAEAEFRSNNYPWGTGPRNPLILVLSALTGTLCEWELWQTVEYTGTLATHKTKSDADPEGAMKGLDAIKKAQQHAGSSSVGEVGYFQRFKNLVSDLNQASGDVMKTTRNIIHTTSTAKTIYGGIGTGLGWVYRYAYPRGGLLALPPG